VTSSIHEMKFLELVDELLRRTQLGQIRWQPTDRPHSYIYALKKGAVRVGRPEAFDERVAIDKGVAITVYDETQRPIQAMESISDDPITQKIRQLYRAAEESAGVSVRVLDSILDELRHTGT
jgi:hypothetical protein